MTDNACGVPSPAPGGPSQWYALRIRSNHERAVASALRFHGFEHFLPVYQAETRWTDRRKTIERPLFPGYIFSRFAIGEGLPVLAIAGVCGVLGGNLTPAVVPDSDIENIHRVITSLLPLTPADYHAGDKVTIQSGALRGVSGVVQRHAGGARLVVNVELMNRAVAVELDAAALAKVKTH